MTVREQIENILRDGRTYTPAALAGRLGLAESDRGMLESILRGMDGVMREGGRYGVYAAFGILECTVQGTRGEHCFAVPDEGEDLYIAKEHSMGAMHGDRVLVQRIASGRRRGRGVRGGRTDEGEIIKILRHANRRIVGELVFDGERAYVIPSSARLNRPVLIRAGAEKEDRYSRVVCRVTAFTQRGALEGEIEEILGRSGEKGVDMLAVIRENGLPDSFSREALDLAQRLSCETVETGGREDLRGQTVFTIDGDDAKDLDDAVSIEKQGENWVLGVHIADVSHYVLPGTELDREALKRGTSVYLPGRVMPMLPPQLSNGICSLSQGQDRLTLSVSMVIDDRGRVLSGRIFPSVIRSVLRTTYSKVASFLRGEEEPSVEIIGPQLRECEKLCRILKDMRRRRGAVDFDFAQPHFTLDAEGRAVGLEAEPREISNEIIEQFMLQANEFVAGFMLENGIPALYRVHESPDAQRISDANEVLKVLGYSLPEKVSAEDYSRLLGAVKGRSEEQLVSMILLRSMKKARYSSENLGHFGLAAREYLHFTSPIRRYPDLIVHRMLHFYLDKNTPALAKYNKRMAELAGNCSDRELAAMEAERQADDIKKAEFAQTLMGECFEGVICSMSASAMWVELPNTLECVLPLANIKGDYYVYNQAACSVTGERTRRVYRMGSRIKIRITEACPGEGRVVAEPAESPEQAGKRVKKDGGTAGKGKRRGGAQRGKRHGKG